MWVKGILCKTSVQEVKSLKTLVTNAVFFVVWAILFLDRILLCSPDTSGNHFVDQAGLELSLSLLCLPSAGLNV